MDLETKLKELDEQAVSVLGELISIKSVQEDPVTTQEGEVYPFGQGVQDAFAYMLKIGSEAGFTVKDVDHYGGHIEFGDGSETVGIMAHLDVVPEGEGWSHEPYGAEIVDGCMYGRGTSDDKGPLLAAFFAMRALKESGFEPERKIRLIMGLDEETGWSGMTYYLEHVGNPDIGFTPDADFPVIYGEKGILHFDIAKKLAPQGGEGLVLRRLSGGTVSNAVPGRARALLNSKNQSDYDFIAAAARETAEATGAKIETKKIGRSFEVTVNGKAAHASTPEKGINAISVLFSLLNKFEFAEDSVADFISFYDSCIGLAHDGAGLGIGFSDDKSGGLTFNVGVVKFDGKSVSISCDIRYPVTYTDDDIYSALADVLDRNGLGIVKTSHQAPVYFDKEGELVTTLLDVYRQETGDTESEPLVIGGGTFARACPNIVAFGGQFPGEPDSMHQKNEYLRIDHYLKMIRIYAEAIKRLAGEKQA